MITRDALLRRLAPVLWWAQNARWRLLRPTVIGVKLLLVRDGQVLLVRQTYLPGWRLPGGGVKRHEELEAAARREAREELGATLRTLRLAGAYRERSHTKDGYVVLFVSEDFDLAPVRCWEIAEARFFPIRNLPANTESASRRRIEEYLTGTPPRAATW